MQPSTKTFTRNHRRQRHGQSLVEFALIALVSYLLLFAILEFGRLFYVAQIVQQTADLAARELSRTPLSANYKLSDALNDPTVQQRVFNQSLLIVPDLSIYSLTDFSQAPSIWPIVNKQLWPLMILETTDGVTSARYPGAVYGSDGSSVVVYQVQADGSTQAHQILEELPSQDIDFSPFQLSAPERGMVMLKVNYPFQAATMPAYTVGDDGYQTVVMEATDPGTTTGVYTGDQGTGSLLAWGKTVQPFHRFVTGQAIYRREVFSGP